MTRISTETIKKNLQKRFLEPKSEFNMAARYKVNI